MNLEVEWGRGVNFLPTAGNIKWIDSQSCMSIAFHLIWRQMARLIIFIMVYFKLAFDWIASIGSLLYVIFRLTILRCPIWFLWILPEILTTQKRDYRFRPQIRPWRLPFYCMLSWNGKFIKGSELQIQFEIFSFIMLQDVVYSCTQAKWLNTPLFVNIIIHHF